LISTRNGQDRQPAQHLDDPFRLVPWSPTKKWAKKLARWGFSPEIGPAVPAAPSPVQLRPSITTANLCCGGTTAGRGASPFQVHRSQPPGGCGETSLSAGAQFPPNTGKSFPGMRPTHLPHAQPEPFAHHWHPKSDSRFAPCGPIASLKAQLQPAPPPLLFAPGP
jgi:hypothetical protein